jgi:hypothetical protein
MVDHALLVFCIRSSERLWKGPRRRQQRLDKATGLLSANPGLDRKGNLTIHQKDVGNDKR